MYTQVKEKLLCDAVIRTFKLHPAARHVLASLAIFSMHLIASRNPEEHVRQLTGLLVKNLLRPQDLACAPIKSLFREVLCNNVRKSLCSTSLLSS
jgi:hypothetical protein